MPRCVSRIFGCGVRVAFLASRVGARWWAWLGACALWLRACWVRECGCAPACVGVKREREGGTCLVGSLLSLFSFCGANDGSRTRCLHLGMVTLYLLSFIRSVFPGCSLLVCLRWGLERMTGLEPAASTLARWRSDLLSYIRMSRRTVLLVAFACLGARCWCLFVSFVYECTRGALFLSTPRRCNIGHTLLSSSLSVVVRRKRSARLLTVYWRDVAVSGMLRLKS